MSTSLAAKTRLMSEYKALQKEKWVKVEVSGLSICQQLLVFSHMGPAKGRDHIQMVRRSDGYQSRELLQRRILQGRQPFYLNPDGG
jgi:hypothetical protein